MTLSDAEICSIALVKIGANEIATFEDETVEADVARRLYDVALCGLVVSHPWHFTLTEVELASVDEPSMAGFAQVFDLPDDMLRAISAGASPRGRGIDYRIAGRRLYANSPSVMLSYQRRPETSEFPAFFLQALVARLAAEFCMPITESTNRAEALFKLAAAELRIARLIDSQQATPRAVEDFTLIAARSS